MATFGKTAAIAVATVGGGGMAAGNTLLRLVGPVGWTISGLMMVGSGLYRSQRNRKAIEKLKQERVKVNREIGNLRVASRKIGGLEMSTRTHIDGTLVLLGWLDKRPNDYQQFTPREEYRLAALVNHIRSLAELFRKEIVL